MNLFCDSTASFSHCETYRYELTRRWRKGGKPCTFIMLNPSTADVEKDDPTVYGCGVFARNWGYDALRVLNLFALRSTNPKGLYSHADPIGPDNDRVIMENVSDSAVIVVAWGNHGKYKKRENDVVSRLLAGFDLYCLGTNGNGSPKHPLYVRRDTELKPWERT